MLKRQRGERASRFEIVSRPCGARKSRSLVPSSLRPPRPLFPRSLERGGPGAQSEGSIRSIVVEIKLEIRPADTMPQRSAITPQPRSPKHCPTFSRELRTRCPALPRRGPCPRPHCSTPLLIGHGGAHVRPPASPQGKEDGYLILASPLEEECRGSA